MIECCYTCELRCVTIGEDEFDLKTDPRGKASAKIGLENKGESI